MHGKNYNLQSSLNLGAGMLRKEAERSVWERRRDGIAAAAEFILLIGMISIFILLGSHGGQAEGANRQRSIAAVTFQRLHQSLPGD